MAGPLVALRNARVLTMDPGIPHASVVHVRDGRIVEVGDADLGAVPADEVVDLGGRWLLPGFIDAHKHLSLSSLFPRWANLLGVRDHEQLHAALPRQAEAEPDAAWIRGASWRGPWRWATAWPCTPYGPTLNTTPASIRRTGAVRDQALPMEHWLHAFTAGAAHAGGQEDERGSVTPGKRAHLVVLDGELDPEHLPTVAQTWVAGTLVWEDGRGARTSRSTGERVRLRSGHDRVAP